MASIISNKFNRVTNIRMLFTTKLFLGTQGCRYFNYTYSTFSCRLGWSTYCRLYSTALDGDDSDVPRNGQFNKNEKSSSTDNGKSEEKPTLATPEEPTTCCMSGCANCVWLEYAEKLAEYYKDGGEQAVKEINEKITDPNIKAYLLHELRMKNKK